MYTVETAAAGPMILMAVHRRAKRSRVVTAT